MAFSNLSDTSVERGLRMVPPFPPIASRLLALFASESVLVTDIAELIGSDPILSARLLQCVNSAAFGLTSRVGNIRQALTLLGLDRTRQLTITAATAAYTGSALRSNELRRCWQHTVATAILADQIAHACGAFRDIAYTAGIMHDIGRLGLLVIYPKEYECIIRDAAEKCHDILDFERQQFGMDHTEAGRILAERWNLPAEYLLIAGRHHDPCEGEELDLIRIVHVACRLADALGYDISRPLVPLEVDAVLQELPSRARDRIRTTPEEMRARVEERIRIYDSGAGDARALTREMPRIQLAEPVFEPEEPHFDLVSTRIVSPKSSLRMVWVAVVVTVVVLTLSVMLVMTHA